MDNFEEGQINGIAQGIAEVQAQLATLEGDVGRRPTADATETSRRIKVILGALGDVCYGLQGLCTFVKTQAAKK